MIKELTINHIIDNSVPHPLTRTGYRANGRMYTENIGDYTLSIVGGMDGLYGDFKEDFEVALIDKEGNFVTSLYSSRGDDVLAYATIDEINELYFNIPRKKFPR